MRLSAALAVVVCLGGCSGTMVDVEFFSNPSIAVSLLEATGTSGTDKPLDAQFLTDGGTLPATVRLLVDGPSLEVTGTAFDLLGQTHRGTGSLNMLPSGGPAKLRVDLTAAGWCPSAPVGPGDLVVFDEGRADGWNQFGYIGPLTDFTDAARACSGSVATTYKVTYQYDGLGFISPRPIQVSQVSLKIWVDHPASIWVGLKDTSASQGKVSVLPTPNQCDADQLPCQIDLTPGWVQLKLPVPTSVGSSVTLIVQFNNPVSQPITTVIDDVRLTLR